MNAWQMDVMKDQMDTEAWNKLNAPDTDIDQIKAAGDEIKTACNLMACAEDYITNALDRLYDDDSFQAKIGSFLDDLEELRCGLSILGNKYARGERE